MSAHVVYIYDQAFRAAGEQSTMEAAPMHDNLVTVEMNGNLRYCARTAMRADILVTPDDKEHWTPRLQKVVDACRLLDIHVMSHTRFITDLQRARA